MSQTYLITGGAGFIGSNLALHFLAQGHRVVVYDNFSRYGAEHNIEWIQARHAGLVVLRGDVRNLTRDFHDAVEVSDVVIHLAAQVAVTTSVTDPRTDFEINALGTFNVLEAVRASRSRPMVLYSSTNKVYGKMAEIETMQKGEAYAYKSLVNGIDESLPLDFYSPYGCSKGTGDQYVADYARIYGLRTVVFRQSCIYGPRQFGIEDQGWVAWFCICAATGRPITIYGDGRQVRDVLFIDDLAAAYDLAIQNAERTAGQVYNIGGGPGSVISLRELLAMLEAETGEEVQREFGPARPGDQLVYVSDIRKAHRDFGWAPKVNVRAGISRLLGWISQEKQLFAEQKSAGIL